MEKVYLLSAVRTPIGSFGGQLSSLSATKLGSIAIKGALDKAGVNASDIEEVFMGNVVSANLGQAPARQAAIFAGIGHNVPCTTVNKVCASGTKAIMLAAQSIMLGNADIVVAGGMESMSNIPFYLSNARYGYKFGNGALVDGLVKDGLSDVYSEKAMGVCADQTASEYNISRETQDEYAINSYKRVAENTENGFFKDEIIPVEIPQRKGEAITISEDEEFKRVKFEKIRSLRPVFSADGTVTAANASTINDGASATILISEKKMKDLSLSPQAEIVAFADAAREPEWFTVAPVLAAQKVLDKAGLPIASIDAFEVNEAFSVVPLAFNQLMKTDASKTNQVGGAVAIGHPLGASGTRIVTTLNNVLRKKGGEFGMAAICNGGGGASAIIIKNSQ